MTRAPVFLGKVSADGDGRCQAPATRAEPENFFFAHRAGLQGQAKEGNRAFHSPDDEMTRLLAPLAALALASACMPCDWSANDCANNWNLNGATVLLIDRVNSAPDATPIPAEQRRAVEEGTLRANPAMAQACSEGLDDRESGQPASLEACRHLFEVNQQPPANPETR